MKLSKKGSKLLHDILVRRSPELLSLSVFTQNGNLSDVERERLRETLSDEFCELGLKPDSEPNQYGLEIEHLIDEIGNV